MPSAQRLFSKLNKHLETFQSTRKPLTDSSETHKTLFLISEDPNDDAVASQSNVISDIKIDTVFELGNVSSSSTFVKRDLGFQGKLGRHIIITYGDTMFSDADGGDEFRGMTCNSVAIASENPTTVFDPCLGDNGYPHCFLRPDEENGEDPSKYALGITNVVETDDGKGIMYFLLNHRPDFKDHLLGSGIAEVSIHGEVPTPKAKRLCKYWWDGETEPWYGDVCALRYGGYIYAYGHAKDNPWVYLTRVQALNATKLECYEYWNGDTWQVERLRTDELNEKQSVFWQVNQGQVIWSKYHQCFLFVYCDNFWSCQVLIKTAQSPEGPWSEPVTVHKPMPVQEGGNVYAAVPHPYFDPSGKTLVITFTNHPNTVQAIKVEFE